MKAGMDTRRKSSRPRRDRDIYLPRPRRDRDVDNFFRDETETRRWCVSRPSRDRDVKTETTTIWNALPPAITSLPSLGPFKRALKTELFRRSYGTANYRPQQHWHYSRGEYVTHSGPEVLFQDLRRDEIRGWWWWWWQPCMKVPFYVTVLTDRQTDRQTDRPMPIKHNLLGGGT